MKHGHAKRAAIDLEGQSDPGQKSGSARRLLPVLFILAPVISREANLSSGSQNA